MATQTPPQKRKYYQSTPQDKKWALLVGVLYVLLAIGLGYMIFKIWPPVPWPEPEKHPKLIAKAMEECATPTPSPSPVASPTKVATTTPAQPATPTPAQSTTPTPAQPAATTPAAEPGADKATAKAEPTPTATPPKEPIAMPISFFFRKCVMTTFDERLLLLVMVAGMLGSFIHGATSLADYVGNNRFSRRWTWFYVLRPVIGMSLALVFYFVVRGGFLTTNVGATDINPYGIAALAGLVGMFSKQATDKLSEVFTTLFRSGEGDDRRADPLDPDASAETLTPVPREVVAGSEGFTLTVNGTGFVEDCKITFDETVQPTTFESATTLTTQVAKETIATARVIKLSVTRPDAPNYPAIDFKVIDPANAGGGGSAPSDELDGHDGAITPDTTDEELPITEGGVK